MITPILPIEIKNMIWARIGYVPSAEALPIHESEAHERFVHGGWRSGKSFVPAAEAATYPVVWKDPDREDGLAGLIWIVGAEYRDARPEFRYMLRWLRMIGYVDESTVVQPSEGRQAFKTTTNWLIETVSAKEIERLGGWTVNVMLIVEAGRHEAGIRTWALGRVVESHGPIIYTGTIERGAQWYRSKQEEYPTYPNRDDVQVFSLPTWSNPKFKGQFDPRLQALKQNVPNGEWLERICGIIGRPKGVVFPEFCKVPVEVWSIDGKEMLSAGRICHVSPLADYDPELEVILLVDPGEVYTVLAAHPVMLQDVVRATGKAIWLPGLFVFDECYLDHGTFDDVRRWVQRQPWYKPDLKSYHDRATIQHHNQKSQYELWTASETDGGLQSNVLYTPEIIGIEDGIDVVHRWLLFPATGRPLVYYHPRCRNAIGEYDKEKYPNNSDYKQRTKPIDKYNHARKALAYYLMHRYGPRLSHEDHALAAIKQAAPTWARMGL